MNYNTDGFNARTNYIYNSNDTNRLNNMDHNHDNTLAQMRMSENKPDIKTTSNEKVIKEEYVTGNKDNFVVRNTNMRTVNTKVNQNNPVANALRNNMFKN